MNTEQNSLEKSGQIQLAKHIWITQLRYLWLFIQMILILVAFSYGYLELQDLGIVLSLNAALVLLNFSIHRRLLNQQSNLHWLKYQIDGDIILFVLFLNSAGGTQNPFYPFFFILIFLQGLFSSQGSILIQALVVLTATFVLQVLPYGKLDINEILSHQTIPYLAIHFLLPLITFFISRSLGMKLDEATSLLDKIQKKEDKLSRLEALGAMTAGLSHEFASPLNAAKLRIERIKKRWPEDEDVRECVLALNDCTDALHHIGKVHRDLDSANYEIIDLKKIKSIIEEWHRGHPEAQLTVNLEDEELRAPFLSFTQTLINLLNNAFEASPASPSLEVTLQRHNESIVLSIKDNGPGFSSGILSRLGQPFNTSKTNGTGLGLYSSELFMSSLGGEMRILNADNGAKVELHFL